MRIGRMLRVLVLLMIACWSSEDVFCAVGRLVEGGVTLENGETRGWSLGGTVLSDVEFRGKFLKGDVGDGKGWEVSLCDSRGDTVARVNVGRRGVSYDEIANGQNEVTLTIRDYGAETGIGFVEREVGRRVVGGAALSVSMMAATDGTAEIWCGDTKLESIGLIPVGNGVTSVSVKATGPVEIVSVNIKEEATETVREMTPWDENSLAERFASTADHREGFYDYLDCDMDTERCRLGGRYRLAVVNDGKGGYDLVYISGAEENSREWETGMLKGKLTPTLFQNHYNLSWLDSGFADDMEDLWGMLDGTLLSLSFPRERTTVRFSRSRQGR